MKFLKSEDVRRSRAAFHPGWLPWAALALGLILSASLLLVVDGSTVCAQTVNPDDVCTLPTPVPVEEGTDGRYITRTPGTLPTMTPQPTDSPAPTATPQPANTPEPTATSQPTDIPAPTATPQPTNPPAPTATTQPTEAPSATSTSEPVATEPATATARQTSTPVPTETDEPTSTATTQPTATNTAQPTPTPTATPLVRVILPPATATATAIATAEPTATQTSTPTTPSPVATSAPGAPATATPTSTSEPPPAQPVSPTDQPQIVSSDGQTSQVGALPAAPSATVAVPTPRPTATPKPHNGARPTAAPRAATATPGSDSGNAQPSSAESLPQNPGEGVQAGASVADASQPLARTSPGGLVYTTAMRRDPAGGYIVVACVANVGEQTVTTVDVLFALAQPEAAITSLRAPAAPGEISSNQARAIIGSIPPRFQTQLEITVRADQTLAAGEVQVNVPKAYRLTDADPALRCDPQGGAGTLPELARAEFTIGGQPVTVQDVAQALFGPVTSTNAAYISSLGSTPIAANGLLIALALTALFIIGLIVIAFAVWRR